MGAIVNVPFERRKKTIPVAVERRSKRERLQHGQRRAKVNPCTCEIAYSEDETEFLLAMQRYKQANRRPFPTWHEVLEVARALGYRKVAEPTELPGLPLPVFVPTGRKGIRTDRAGRQTDHQTEAP
jgi:hypothetical protein